MAKGKQGLYLESWKFAVYLAVPIAASWYYSDPQRQKESADYWQYVKYPANPNVNMKEQIEVLAAQQKQRNAYREQMKELQAQAARAEQARAETSQRRWWNWKGFGREKSATES